MTLKSYWRKDGISPIIHEDDLIKQLSSRNTGIVFLSTVPSSNGETRVVQALTGEKNAKVFYCRDIIEKIVSIIKKPHDCIAVDELCERLREYPLIIIRFVDRIYGLTATMENLAKVFTNLSKDRAVIVTGDYLDHYVPELIQQLPEAEQFYICY